MALINTRKLICKVISRVKLRNFKTDVTKVIHAIMEMEEHSHHESEESEQQRWQKLYGDMIFVDYVHGGLLLKRDKVIEARKIEMKCFRKMGVYEKVHRSKARGYKVITTRWVDTNKGVGNEDNYRSRLVGRELNFDKRNDLFTNTTFRGDESTYQFACQVARWTRATPVCNDRHQASIFLCTSDAEDVYQIAS